MEYILGVRHQHSKIIFHIFTMISLLGGTISPTTTTANYGLILVDAGIIMVSVVNIMMVTSDTSVT